MQDFADYFRQAILDAREERTRLDALAQKRPLRESDYKTLDRMLGKTVTLVSDLLYAADEAEMTKIASRLIVRKRD